ncbi:MAG: aspartate/glutamate racemase family protein, partial [Verrucomicrobiota bacterium]
PPHPPPPPPPRPPPPPPPPPPIVEFLLKEGVEVVVLACNSATIQAVEWCRERWPEVRFVGMEPGVKPAVAATKSGVIGVLATEASLTGEMFAELVVKYGEGCEVLPQACPRFVEFVEAGVLEGPEVEEAVREYAGPLVEAGADVLVLGCTHYPFLKEVIGKVYPGVALVDTGEAVARRVGSVLELVRGSRVGHGLALPVGGVRFLTSGEVGLMRRFLEQWREESGEWRVEKLVVGD